MAEIGQGRAFAAVGPARPAKEEGLSGQTRRPTAERRTGLPTNAAAPIPPSPPGPAPRAKPPTATGLTAAAIFGAAAAASSGFQTTPSSTTSFVTSLTD